MNISEIRQKAIPYYACFIARVLGMPGNTLTLQDIHLLSKTDREEGAESGFYLSDLNLIERAVEFLETANVVRSVTDDFAPKIVIQHTNFSQNLASLYRDENTVFGRYNLAGEGRRIWLLQALNKINSRLKEEEKEDSDEKDSDDPVIDSWEPIPLTRSDQQQSRAIEALDRLIEELRGDNGYATTNAEEKAFVQDALAAATKRLKENTQISWMYLREFAFKPLQILASRFGKAAIGLSAVAAKEALSSWLKSKGLHFLDDIFK